MDTVKGLKFLKCEYNRDGDSWRSSYSQSYYPPLDVGDDEPPFVPSGMLLELEGMANISLREYSKLYFGDAITNAYFFETTESGFGAVFLIKHEIEGS